jgi:hypothetical protein
MGGVFFFVHMKSRLFFFFFLWGTFELSAVGMYYVCVRALLPFLELICITITKKAHVL